MKLSFSGFNLGLLVGAFALFSSVAVWVQTLIYVPLFLLFLFHVLGAEIYILSTEVSVVVIVATLVMDVVFTLYGNFSTGETREGYLAMVGPTKDFPEPFLKARERARTQVIGIAWMTVPLVDSFYIGVWNGHYFVAAGIYSVSLVADVITSRKIKTKGSLP